jgi:hypothetical protein
VTNEALSEDDRLVILEAIVELRFGEAVRYLISLLEGSSSLAQSVAWALSSLTRQEFGRDRGAWDAWWKAHSSQHRVEWLIDALTHENDDIRRAARDELESISQRQFQVSPGGGGGFWQDLKAQFQTWWETVGRAAHH